MLKLTRKTEYALIALKHMLAEDPQRVVNTAEIARRYHIPKELLAKALQQMARHGFVEPVQGARGGYRVAPGLNQISLDEFLERMEGPLALVVCADDHECPIEDACCIQTPLTKLNATMRRFFAGIRLTEITS